MQTGIRRALPSEESSTKPRARGPASLFDLRAICAGAICARLKLTAAQMTTHSALRYNDVRIGKATMLDVNDKAPDIKLEDENGKEVSLKDFKGKTVVLYFYPRADTPGCTKEACSFRDDYKKIQKMGVVRSTFVIGPDGKIRHVFHKVKPEGHSEEVLEYLKQ